MPELQTSEELVSILACVEQNPLFHHHTHSTMPRMFILIDGYALLISRLLEVAVFAAMLIFFVLTTHFLCHRPLHANQHRGYHCSSMGTMNAGCHSLPTTLVDEALLRRHGRHE